MKTDLVRGCLYALLLVLQPLAAGNVSAETPRPQVRLLVQSSALAGYRYHEAKAHWGEFARGDALALVREPDNPHDPGAIAVFWRNHKLGYVPRSQNAALAWAMDRGEQVSARISALRAEPNPRKRVEFEVFVE